MSTHEIYRSLLQLSKQGAACLSTIVETRGSTPRKVGAKMIICIDGTTFGSIGGGCGESIVRSAALRCLVTTKSCELLEVELTDEMGEKEGDVCGGSMSVFLEPFGV